VVQPVNAKQIRRAVASSRDLINAFIIHTSCGTF
jgi:hypothetical protein